MRAHGGTETGEQRGIGPVGFIARPFALRKAFDTGRIDHINHESQLKQRQCNCFAIRPGRFPADVGACSNGATCAQPFMQLRIPLRGVVEHLGVDFAGYQQGNIQLAFTYVDANTMTDLAHRSDLPRMQAWH